MNVSSFRRSRCLFCGRSSFYDPAQRLCDCDFGGKNNPSIVSPFHLSVFPFFDNTFDIAKVPPAGPHGFDILPTLAENIPSGAYVHKKPLRQAHEHITRHFPAFDMAQRLGFPAGNPRIVRDSFHRFQNVSVLDFTTLNYSRTLKDIRAAVLIPYAFEMQVKDLLIYSEGNNGQSCGYLSDQINKSCGEDVQTLHALVRQGIDPDIQGDLSQVRVNILEVDDLLEVSGNNVFLRESDLLSEVESKTRGAINPKNTWHISDLYAGDDVLAYYLVWVSALKQRTSETIALRDKPRGGLCPFDAVVAPVGSGALFVALLLAVQDLFGSDGDPYGANLGPRVFAAVPHNCHFLLDQFPCDTKGKEPLADKLAGVISPVQPFLNHALLCGRFSVLPFTMEDQIDARKQLYQSGTPRLKFEPASLASRAALKNLNPDLLVGRHLGSRLSEYGCNAPILIVNSGAGTISREYRNWVRTGEITYDRSLIPT